MFKRQKLPRALRDGTTSVQTVFEKIIREPSTSDELATDQTWQSENRFLLLYRQLSPIIVCHSTRLYPL